MEESKVFYSHTLKIPINANTFNPLDIFTREHGQDCCEQVYVDTDHLDSYRDMINEIQRIVKIEFRTAPGDGFIIKIYSDDTNNYGIYFPCRNIQNGYYNDEIDLTIDIENIITNFELQGLGCINNEWGGS